jgi:hypothetical protein
MIFRLHIGTNKALNTAKFEGHRMQDGGREHKIMLK